jgi:hypothetical protein
MVNFSRNGKSWFISVKITWHCTYNSCETGIYMYSVLPPGYVSCCWLKSHFRHAPVTSLPASNTFVVRPYPLRSWRYSRGLNTGPPSYEAGVPASWNRRSLAACVEDLTSELTVQITHLQKEINGNLWFLCFRTKTYFKPYHKTHTSRSVRL